MNSAANDASLTRCGRLRYGESDAFLPVLIDEYLDGRSLMRGDGDVTLVQAGNVMRFALARLRGSSSGRLVIVCGTFLVDADRGGLSTAGGVKTLALRIKSQVVDSSPDKQTLNFFSSLGVGHGNLSVVAIAEKAVIRFLDRSDLILARVEPGLVLESTQGLHWRGQK